MEGKIDRLADTVNASLVDSAATTATAVSERAHMMEKITQLQIEKAHKDDVLTKDGLAKTVWKLATPIATVISAGVAGLLALAKHFLGGP